MKAELANQNSILFSLIDTLSQSIEDEFGFEMDTLSNTWLLGAGKGSVLLAKELQKKNSKLLIDGIIISNQKEEPIGNIQVFKGSHPYPDKDSVSSSYELLELARNIPVGETVIFCLSGGGFIFALYTTYRN